MTLTAFGRLVRKKRIDASLTMQEMAKILDVSSSYISMAETGQTLIPSHWGLKISECFKLKPEEIADLFNTIQDSNRIIQLKKGSIRIDLDGCSLKCREAALSFASHVPNLSDEKATAILSLLDHSVPDGYWTKIREESTLEPADPAT